MKSPLLIFGTLLALLLAGALATPFFVDWSSYRAEIEDYGRKAIGRDVRIAGDIDIQFLPLPTLTLEDVRVANVENANSPVFLSVKMLEARLLLAPLLRGQVQVHSVILDRPELDLERLASGKGNWVLEPSEELARIVPLSGFSLEETKVVDGVIYVSDRRRSGRARFDQVNLKISVGSATGPYQARGTVAYEGDPINVSVSTGKIRPDGTMRLGVRVKPQTGTRLHYSFDGKLLGQSEEQIASGMLKVAPPEIDDTAKSSPLTNLEKLPFLFSSKVAIGEEKLRFENIELALDQANAVTNAVTGSAEFTLGYDIGFDATLSARRLDLDALAQDLGSQLAQRLKSAVSLDTLDAVAGLLPKNVYGRVQVSSGQLKTGSAVIETGKLDVSVSDTGLKVRELSGLLPGRTRFELSGLYLPDPVTPQFNGAFKFNALDGRGFINWMRPGLYGEESGRIGRLKFSGSLSATPEHGRINGANFEFEGGTGSGSLFWARSGTPFIEAELSSDALDLTTVMPRGREAGLLDGPALVGQLNTGGAPLGLNMKIGQLTFASRTLKDFVANVKFNGAAVDIRRLAGTVGEKGKIDLAGSLAGQNRNVNGEVSGKVSSPDAIEMLQVLGVGEMPGRLHKLLDGEPLDVWLEYVSNPEKNRLSVEGVAGAGLVGLVLETDGPFANWRKVNLDVDGVYETNRAHRLLSALDLGPSEALLSGKADGKVSLLASGALPSGITANLKARILSGTLDVTADFEDPGTGLAVRGKVKASSLDAKRITRALGAGVAFEGEAALAAQFDGDSRRYRIAGFTMDLPGIKGRFDGSLTPKNDTFQLSGAGRFDTLDLGSALGLLTLGPPLEGAPGEAFWADRPFRSTALSDLMLDVRVSTEKLVLAPGAVLNDARFTVKAEDDKLTIANGSGDLYGGSLQGGLEAARTASGNLAVKARVDLSDAALADVLRDKGGKPLAHGTLSLEGNVEGEGRSPGGIISVLKGNGAWALGNSRLVGTDPGGFSQSIDNIDDAAKLEGLISTSLHQGEWRFQPVRSEWSVESGLVKLVPGQITSDVAAGRVGALANLVNGELNADWTVQVAGVAEAPAYQVKLEGPVGGLARSHDTTSLRSFLVVRVLQESMRKLEELQREQERLFEEREKAKQQPPAQVPGESETTEPEPPANKVNEEVPAENAPDQEAAQKALEDAEKQAAEAAAKKAQEEAARKEAERQEAARKEAERAELERLAAEAAERERAEQERAREIERKQRAFSAAQEQAAQRKRAAAQEAARREARRKQAEEARAAARAVAEAEALRAAQEREGGDSRALGLQQLRESGGAQDDNR
ncbi:MAG: AsmA family protein [Pseudomonadota bacterium]